MQQYKSEKNIETERQWAHRNDKQRGEITFELSPFFSGSITTVFTREYQEIPFVTHTLLLEKSRAFDVHCVLSGITKKDFTIEIENISSEAVKGTIMWKTE